MSKNKTHEEYNQILNSLKLSVASVIVSAMRDQCMTVSDLAARSGEDIKVVRGIITGEIDGKIDTIAGLLFTLGRRGRFFLTPTSPVTITATTA